MADQKAALHTPCWTELAVPDPAAAQRFYGDVFGWRGETDPRPEAGGYTMFKIGQAPVAAVMPLSNDSQPVAWSVCLAVADAEATAAEVRAHGGTVLMPPAEVFDLGSYGVLADPGGAAFSIWQAKAFGGAEIMGDPNSLGWIELSSRDVPQALEFYPAVFGWATHLSDFYTEWSLGDAHFGGLVDLNSLPGPSGDAAPHWKPYFTVADVDEAASKTAAAGGGVLMPPENVPGDTLRISVLRDPQGAVFGVFGPAKLSA
jgi:predicted enzyme related to lactoylglutathione lyase